MYGGLVYTSPIVTFFPMRKQVLFGSFKDKGEKGEYIQLKNVRKYSRIILIFIYVRLWENE